MVSSASTAKLSGASRQRTSAQNGLLIAQQLREKTQDYKTLLVEVMKWTGGQPLLVQMVSRLVVEANDAPKAGTEAMWLEHLIYQGLINNWEDIPELEQMRAIRDRLIRRKHRNIRLLKLYQRLLERGEIPVENSPEQRELESLGLVAKSQDKLRIHNRIYEMVFNSPWVDSALKRIQVDPELSDSEFRRTLVELERKLLLSQVEILSQAETNSEDLKAAQTLYEVLRYVTAKVADLVGADRASIFLLNDEKNELWSLVAENEEGEFLDIQVPIGEGIAGQVAQTRKLIHIPNRVYDDPRAALVKTFDQRYHYKTENILALPILNESRELIAVVQVLNKLLPQGVGGIGQTNPNGFSKIDLERLSRCLVPIRRILESCQSCYKAIRKLQATAALAEATRSLDQINLDTKAILQRVMNTAKKLMNADRSTLWLVDRDQGDLWTEIPGRGEVRCPIGIGFVGQVAQTCEPMIIPFDLYDHPMAENAKRVDEQTRYRTCSLLCMPVVSPDGELLGVTQLVNKRKSGHHAEYSKDDWPLVPDYFKTGFDKNDQQAMQVFNDRVGVILQFVKTHETLKQLSQVKPKEAIYNALAVLSNAVSDQSDDALYQALHHMLTYVSESLSRLLSADYTTIFLLDAEETGFWTLCNEDGTGGQELRISSTLGLAGKILETKATQAVRNIHKFQDVLIHRGIGIEMPRDRQSMLLFPILDGHGKVTAIIRLFNKLKPALPGVAGSATVDVDGFTKEDADRLSQCTETLLPILQAFQSFQREILTIQAQRRALDPLYQAISFVSQSSGNPEELIHKVMQAAKNLTNADRSTLWLIDQSTNELWTVIAQADGSWLETRVPMGEGFVGVVAKTGRSVNIPYDLYDHPSSHIARKTDEKNRYRTCSLLCMPVLGADGELLGVTQLVNKRKPGDHPPYNAEIWPQVPDYFRASFAEKDHKDMEVFNNQVGVILPDVLNCQSRDRDSEVMNLFV